MDYHRNIVSNFNPICSICYFRSSKFEHSCGHYFCQECLKNWALTSIKTRATEGQDEIPCLQNTCSVKLTFKDLQQSLTKEQMEDICVAYNENYFTQAPDVSRCPRENCSYVGVIKLEACKDSLKCHECNYEWRELAHQTWSELLRSSIKNTFRFSPESFNYANKVFWSNPCPQCGMFIEKLSGCNHMVCQYCKYEFCWMCLGHYPGYIHKGDTICGIRALVSVGFTFAVLLLAVTYFCYLNANASFFVRIFFKSIGKFLLSNLCVLSLFLNLVFALGYADKVKNCSYTCCDKITLYLNAISMLTWPISWLNLMYIIYYSYGYSFIVMWPLYEIAIVVGLTLLAISCMFLYFAAYYLVYCPARWLIRKTMSRSFFFKKSASLKANKKQKKLKKK